MKTNADLMARRAAALPRGVGQAHPVFAQRAENAEIWDVEGRRWIDFCAGIAVVNTGHRHPKVMAAARAQLDQFTHTCFQVVAYEGYVELCERINKLAPGPTPKKSFLINSGAEAVENAVKIARVATKRAGIIAFGGGFHGRTMYTMALTGKVEPYKLGFGPFPGEIYHVPFPDALHGVSEADSIHAIERLFKYDIEASRVAAIIIEPVQGEGGYIPAPPEFFKKLRALCDQHGILLIADEVQTGAARCGKMFATEHYGIEPDIITMAKGLTSGYAPLGAMIAGEHLAEPFLDPKESFLHGFTFGGHPVSCAVAMANLDVLEGEKIIEGVREHEGEFKAALDTLYDLPIVGDVRGMGYFYGIELVKDRDTKESFDDAECEKLLRGFLSPRLFELGLICRADDRGDPVIQLSPPLVAGPQQFEEMADIIRTALVEAMEVMSR